MSQKKSPPVSALRNLGPKSAARLAEAGIETEANLRAIGAAAAYRRLRHMRPDSLSLNMLWALQGALLDIDFRELPEEMKAELRREVEGAGD